MIEKDFPVNSCGSRLKSMISESMVQINPDNKVHGANMGPIWGQQDPGGPHVGPMNFAICEVYNHFLWNCL